MDVEIIKCVSGGVHRLDNDWKLNYSNSQVIN